MMLTVPAPTDNAMPITVINSAVAIPARMSRVQSIYAALIAMNWQTDYAGKHVVHIVGRVTT